MITKRRWTVALCLGLLTALCSGQRLAADSESQQWKDLKAQMAAEGWTQIAEGVFERQRSATKVEHLGYGREGLAWTIAELHRQLGSLINEYNNYPSEDLAKVIDNLSLTIANAKRELRSMPKSLTGMNAAVTGPSCGSICYSATADASHLTSTQGVSAVAEAKFNNTCGYTGTTYAYAFARATLNGTTTTITREDPDSGTAITSTVTATVNGGSIAGTPCYSTANSYAQSTALGIAYSTSDTNDGVCPVPVTPLSVTINGTTFESFMTLGCRSRTWTSTVSGGTPPYTTYQWKYNGTVVGSASSYTRSVCPAAGSFTLDLTVTDSSGATKSDTHFVTVELNQEPPCNPICP